MPGDQPDFSAGSALEARHLATLNVLRLNPPLNTITVPGGAHGLLFASPNNLGAVAVQAITGHTSAAHYWTSDLAGGAPFTGRAIFIPLAVDTGFEAQLDVAWQSDGAAGQVQVEVFAVFDPEAPLTSSASPLMVQLTGSVGAPSNFVQVAAPLGSIGASGAVSVALASDQAASRQGQHIMSSSLPVVIASDQSAVSVAMADPPTPDKSAVFNGSLAASATSTLFAAAALARLYSLAWSADSSAATARMVVSDTAGAAIYVFHSYATANSLGGGQLAWGTRGLPAGGDRGLLIKNSGTATSGIMQLAVMAAST